MKNSHTASHKSLKSPNKTPNKPIKLMEEKGESSASKKQRRSRLSRLSSKANPAEVKVVTLNIVSPKSLSCHFTPVERIQLSNIRTFRQLETKVCYL